MISLSGLGQDTLKTDSDTIYICLPEGILYDMVYDIKEGDRCDSIVSLLKQSHIVSTKIISNQDEIISLYEQNAEAFINRERFLREQLDNIRAQRTAWQVVVGALSVALFLSLIP